MAKGGKPGNSIAPTGAPTGKPVERSISPWRQQLLDESKQRTAHLDAADNAARDWRMQQEAKKKAATTAVR